MRPAGSRSVFLSSLLSLSSLLLYNCEKKRSVFHLLDSADDPYTSIANFVTHIPTISYNFLQFSIISYNFLQFPTISYNFLQFPTISYNFLQFLTISYLPGVRHIKMVCSRAACKAVHNKRHAQTACCLLQRAPQICQVPLSPQYDYKCRAGTC